MRCYNCGMCPVRLVGGDSVLGPPSSQRARRHEPARCGRLHQARRAARRAACRARRTAVSFTESDTPVSQPAVELQLCAIRQRAVAPIRQRTVDASRPPSPAPPPTPAPAAAGATTTRGGARRRPRSPPPRAGPRVEAATAREPRHAWGSVEAATARREPHRTAQVRRSSDQRTACGANHRVEGQVVHVHAASRLPDP